MMGYLKGLFVNRKWPCTKCKGVFDSEDLWWKTPDEPMAPAEDRERYCNKCLDIMSED